METEREKDSESSSVLQESFIILPSDSCAASEPWKMSDQILTEIKRCQETCKASAADCLSLESSQKASEQEITKFREELELLYQNCQKAENEAIAEEASFQKILQLEMEEADQLLQEKWELENELEHLECLQTNQYEFFKGPAAFPEREMVFKGHMEDGKMGNWPAMLTILPQIRCPIRGGSALITFEDSEVASRIISMGQHRIQLDEWSYVHIKAEPVMLMLPSFLEVALERNARQVLVSGVPVLSLPKHQLHDKLTLFFSKRKNQGGEVEHLKQQRNSEDIVITFVEDGVAERIVKKGLFQVYLGGKTHEVKVAHCLAGKIADVQLCPSVCARSVLLSGIPDVLEKELMHEALEIHFQKPSKGGGEVEGIVYVPAGHRAVAVFEEEED